MRMRCPRSASICVLAAALIAGAAGQVNAQSDSSHATMLPNFAKGGTTILQLDPCPWVLSQSNFAPYYGKNQIHYDTFDWHIYKTDHFEIYYYPANEQHL